MNDSMPTEATLLNKLAQPVVGAAPGGQFSCVRLGKSPLTYTIIIASVCIFFGLLINFKCFLLLMYVLII